MEYKILQAKMEAPFKFRELSESFDLNWYETVYEGILSDMDDIPSLRILGYLFKKFNLYHPFDFKGHSLSVSDIIILEGIYYYCSPYGWDTIDSSRLGA